MTAFQLTSWAFCLLTSLCLGTVLLKNRYLLVKPSMVFLLCFHLQVQWAAAVRSDYLEEVIARPYRFAILVHGFPLLGLIGAFMTARKTARETWRRVTDPEVSAALPPRSVAVLLAVGVGIVAAWYLASVPWRTTGLIAIFTDPVHSMQAREQSLKLLPSAALRYAFFFVYSVLAPLLASFMTLYLLQAPRRRRFLTAALITIAFGALMLLVSLPGSRIAAVKLVVVGLVTWLLIKGLPVRPKYLVMYGAVGLILLLVPAMLSIVRTRRAFTLENLNLLMFEAGMVHRMFETPMHVGSWYFRHTEDFGYFDGAGIPKLAVLLGIPPVDVPNVVGLQNMRNQGNPSASAVTSFVFAFYADFGLFALPLSLAALWLLDALVWFYRHIGDRLILPGVAVMIVACMGLIETAYTTALLTHGLLIIPVMLWLLDGLRRLPGMLRSNSAAATGVA